MAEARTFHCSVITPERTVLECDAKFAAFPAHDGEMGVLTRRAPLVCKVGVGLLRVDTLEETHTMMVDEGFAQVLENRLTVLTERATRAADVDPGAAQDAFIEAKAMPIPDETAAADREKALARARVQIKLARIARSGRSG